MTSQAFELAYFIHPSRDVALSVTREAWVELDAHLRKQEKRRYYIPLGRLLGGLQVRARTKVSFDDSQKLQSLIYLKSESAEIKQEADWLKETEKNQPDFQDTDDKQLNNSIFTPRILPLTSDDWLIRFIKHLAAISTSRSSFYVTLAIGREIFNYTTEEAVEMYYAIVPSEERWKDGQYFRKRRNEVLVKELKKRFGSLLQTRVAAHGEHRFKCRPDAERFAPLVKQCLEMFTPWNTECIDVESWNPMNKGTTDELCFDDNDLEKEHPIEARRIHTLIHPDCFAHLTTALALASPNERLEVPMFHFDHSETDDRSGHGPGSPRRPPTPLTPAEVAEIESGLKNNRGRRKQARPDNVTVMVDGVERERISLNEKPVRVHVDESARLIEIVSHDSAEELLLGSVLLDRRELLRATRQPEYGLRFPNGPELSLKLSPLPDVDGEFVGADIEVSLRKAHSFGASAMTADGVLQNAGAALRRPAFVFGLLAILIGATTVALLVSRIRRPRTEYVAQEQPQASPLTTNVQQGVPPNGKTSPAVRAEQSQLPPNKQNLNDKTKEPAGESTRSLSVENERDLSALKRIYVTEGDTNADKDVRAVFINAIKGSGKVQITNEASAEAYLYVDLKRHESSTQLEARLMGRSGNILWNALRTFDKPNKAISTARAMAQDLSTRLAR